MATLLSSDKGQWCKLPIVQVIGVLFAWWSSLGALSQLWLLTESLRKIDRETSIEEKRTLTLVVIVPETCGHRAVKTIVPMDLTVETFMRNIGLCGWSLVHSEEGEELCLAGEKRFQEYSLEPFATYYMQARRPSMKGGGATNEVQVQCDIM
jgi:hypothetical protein